MVRLLHVPPPPPPAASRALRLELPLKLRERPPPSPKIKPQRRRHPLVASELGTSEPPRETAQVPREKTDLLRD
ncbi:MAG: hypothetical protein HY721_28180 [Planctomycetes bacterium]|nr:hypothetical protein [Planctomycetota bacterium]